MVDACIHSYINVYRCLLCNDFTIFFMSISSGWVFVAAGGESEAPMKQPKKKGTERKKVQRRGTLKQSFSKVIEYIYIQSECSTFMSGFNFSYF